MHTFCLLGTRFHLVAQNGLEFMAIPSKSPEFWDLDLVNVNHMPSYKHETTVTKPLVITTVTKPLVMTLMIRKYTLNPQ